MKLRSKERRRSAGRDARDEKLYRRVDELDPDRNSEHRSALTPISEQGAPVDGSAQVYEYVFVFFLAAMLLAAFTVPGFFGGLDGVEWKTPPPPLPPRPSLGRWALEALGQS